MLSACFFYAKFKNIQKVIYIYYFDGINDGCMLLSNYKEQQNIKVPPNPINHIISPNLHTLSSKGMPFARAPDKTPGLMLFLYKTTKNVDNLHTNPYYVQHRQVNNT